MTIIALHYLFTAMIMIIAAVNHPTADAAAAFALSPPRAAANERPNVDDGGNNNGWMDDWMLRFGGVARYV